MAGADGIVLLLCKSEGREEGKEDGEEKCVQRWRSAGYEAEKEEGMEDEGVVEENGMMMGMR